MSRAAFPVAIAGPSGVGKTVLVNELLARDATLIESISATSRAPRAGEEDRTHYYFHDKDGFEKLIRDGHLLEWARVHGCYYGTPIAPLEANLAAGRTVLLNIDVQGAANLKKSRPDAVLVFIFPPSMEELENRLRKRGTDASSDIETRLRNARQEISAAGGFDYFVVNDDVERATAVLESILSRERAK